MNDAPTTKRCKSGSCAFCLVPSVRYEKIKFLVIALKNAVEVYAWAPKPYHKFMAFKVGETRLKCAATLNLKYEGQQ